MARRFGLVDLLFCRNSSVPLCSFTTEKLMSGARSLKGRLAINSESLLLHGDEGRIEQYKQREIKERAESKRRNVHER